MFLVNIVQVLLFELVGCWSLKDRRMACAQVAYLRLTNSRVFVFYVKMNDFRAHLMLSSGVEGSKVLRVNQYQACYPFLCP